MTPEYSDTLRTIPFHRVAKQQVDLHHQLFIEPDEDRLIELWDIKDSSDMVLMFKRKLGPTTKSELTFGLTANAAKCLISLLTHKLNQPNETPPKDRHDSQAP